MKSIHLLSFLLYFLVFSSCLYQQQISDKTGIKGLVIDEKGKTVPDAYVYIYRSISTGLMGPADFMEKTDEKGNFYFDIPEGKYYLVVRKRQSGYDAGPLRQGDRVAIYSKNPIVLRDGVVQNVKVLLPTKGSIFQKRLPKGDKEIEIKLLGKKDKGVFVLIYEGADRKGSPHFVMEAMEDDIKISLPKEKEFYIVIREGLKEKIEEGELFGVYGPFIPENLKFPILIKLDRHK